MTAGGAGLKGFQKGLLDLSLSSQLILVIDMIYVSSLCLWFMSLVYIPGLRFDIQAREKKNITVEEKDFWRGGVHDVMIDTWASRTFIVFTITITININTTTILIATAITVVQQESKALSKLQCLIRWAKSKRSVEDGSIRS